MLRVTLLVLFSNIVVVSGQDFGGFGGPDGEGKVCPPFRCSKGQEPVPKWPLKMESTGCNGMGGMAMFSPKAGADPTAKCCDIRHACYQTCGTLKSYCDQEFLKCSKATCASIANEEERKSCDSSASIHELMVKMDQCQRYDQDQYSRCECVDKSKAPAKRERLLRNFYKKFSPDSLDKVPALAKKVNNSSKMAGLLLKLVKKYPQVIKKKKDPQQEMMERMMKETGQDTDSDQENDSEAEDLGIDEL